MPARTITDAQLQALVAVVDHGGFTAAARQLRLSQSAVSHAITGLEQALKVALLTRTARGVQPTEVGERIVEYSREVLRLKALIREDARATRKRRRGILRIGSFGVSASRRLLPPLMDAFAHRYPEVTVSIVEGDDQQVEQWLRDGSVDIGFITLPNDDFDTLDLSRDEMNVLLPADHRLAAHAHIQPRDLGAEPFIMSTGGCEPAIRASVPGVSLDVRYRIRDNDTVVAMVARHAGISILPTLSLPEPLPAGVVHRPLAMPYHRSIALAVMRRETVSPACEAFLKLAGAGSVAAASQPVQ